MLISFSNQFIFIASPKTASTAIENQLRSFSQICLTETSWGKHMTLVEAENNFSWVKKWLPNMKPFVFGVVRDPLDYIISVYNSHRNPAFEGRPQYTGNISFEAFWAAWSQDRRFAWIFTPQISRFLGSSGAIAADYIVDHARLNDEWPALCDRLKVPVQPLMIANKSPEGFGRDDVPPELAAMIYERFAPDVEALRQYAGRPLR